MKSKEEIARLVPYVKSLGGDTYCTELTVNGIKGSVVYGFRENGYEHVSFSPYNKKIPKWEDMCALKDIFWNDEEEAYQIMPKKTEYVNIKDNCLHLWRPANGKILDDLI